MLRTSSPYFTKLNSQGSRSYWKLCKKCRGVVTYKGKLVENLHVVMAEKIVQQHDLIEKMKWNMSFLFVSHCSGFDKPPWEINTSSIMFRFVTPQLLRFTVRPLVSNLRFTTPVAFFSDGSRVPFPHWCTEKRKATTTKTSVQKPVPSQSRLFFIVVI